MLNRNLEMDKLHQMKAFICDMDGVIYHGSKLLPGVLNFIDWLKLEKKQFLFLTNNSQRSPEELREKLLRLGADVSEEHFYTSALATAEFLKRQRPNGSAFVVGEAGLTKALTDVGFTLNDVDPDYVVVGFTPNYSYEKMERAAHLVQKGAKLIGTDPDLSFINEKGISPGTGALVAPIELTTGANAYYVGKPNPLIMRLARKKLNATAQETILIGDRMDTDIIAGVEAEIITVLVLSGVTKRADLERFSYQPDYILEGVGDIIASLNGAKLDPDHLVTNGTGKNAPAKVQLAELFPVDLLEIYS